MPTPANTARQCLTKEAEQALDEAIAVARRRRHAQTTSLHMVSSLLSLPSSSLLREACSRTRNNAYSTRVQFKALDLSLGVSLDRLPTSPNPVEEPPVSNSLMAAIKRSQANQRRQPENFNLFCSSSSSISVVKVELRNLILSILDDPIVSRVFGEAGFRSCEIKVAIMRPIHHQMFKYSRYNEVGGKGFSFPFMGFSGVLDGDENLIRIGEVMIRRRNPLLVGVYAYDSVRNFLEMVKGERGKSVLPVELPGLGVICIENEISRFVNGNCEEGIMKLRLEEVRKMVNVGNGVVVNFGDLKVLTGDGVLIDALRSLVSEFASLLEVHRGKVWLIGSTARFEMYSKFLNMFPSIENDWDLQLLPITNLKFSTGESYPRSSLMESFVPFGGFFSAPSDVKSPLSSSYNVSRDHVCNERCDQEVNAISNGGFSRSVADHYRPNLPSWLQMSEFSSSSTVEAKDDGILRSTKIAALHRKWDDFCHHLHHGQQSSNANNTNQLDSQVPSVVEFQVPAHLKTNVSTDSRSHKNASLSKIGGKTVDSREEEDFDTAKATSPSSFLSKAIYPNFQPKFDEMPSKVRENHGLGSPFNTSPTSVTSATLDLNLESTAAYGSIELEKPRIRKHLDIIQDSSFCSPTNREVASGSDSSNQSKSSCSHPDIDEQFDQDYFKTLYATLAIRIGRQEEALKIVSQTLAHSKTRNERRSRATRGDIWFHFIGPDRLGKKELAVALSEILHGSRENLIHVNLGFQDKVNYSKTPSDHRRWNSHDVSYRGKNVVDYIAEKLDKMPLPVVFLESIEKADLLVQNSLLQAMKTGRFSDSLGREVSTCNATFVTTSRLTGVQEILDKKTADYSEESILAVKCWPIQMMIGFDLRDDFIRTTSSMSETNTKENPSRIIVNKRKLVGNIKTMEQCSDLEVAKRAHRGSYLDLDLNFPAEESEIYTTSPGNSESESIFDNSRTWLVHFSGLVDATVVFQPFDFDALAQKILQDISEAFRKIVSSECSLEIDSRIMMQMIAAAYLINYKAVEDWVHRVLAKGFEEAQQRYSLNARSTVKLVASEGTPLRGQTPAEFLPSRIIIN